MKIKQKYEKCMDLCCITISGGICRKLTQKIFTCLFIHVNLQDFQTL